jgi:hypothetical protein
MPRPAKALPIYQKNGGWYADLRRYQDVGGERVALMVPGEPKGAVTDRRMAFDCRRNQFTLVVDVTDLPDQNLQPPPAAGAFLAWLVRCCPHRPMNGRKFESARVVFERDRQPDPWRPGHHVGRG